MTRGPRACNLRRVRIALLSDIHANLEALEACLEHAANGARAERLVFLGDLVGYGADPGPVVERVRALAEAGAVALMGNHDEAAVRGAENFTRDAGVAIRWTAERLSDAQKSFLAALPMEVQEEDRLYVHADAANPAAWRYVETAEDARRSLEATRSRLTFCGHTHVPALFALTATGKLAGHRPPADTPMPLLAPRQWLAVLGAVGQPRDGSPAACYGLLDAEAAELTWHRVPYDVAEAARKIRAAGLPDRLAARLSAGA